MACWDGKHDADELSPQCYTRLGQALNTGVWYPDLESMARARGVDVTWKRGNEWSDACAETIMQDFSPDPDGPYAHVLEMAGLRDEDQETAVGDSNHE